MLVIRFGFCEKTRMRMKMKMKSKTLTLKVLIPLFILNSITICFYSSSHSNHFHSSPPANGNQSHSPFPHHAEVVSISNFNKPWPILPSYLPWSLSPNNVPDGSCEAYFGNGFTRRVDLLKPSSRKPSGGGGGGWFRCFYSRTLQSSICEGGRIRMHPEKIKMSPGGEELESVIGRKEHEELPEFEFGAFDLEVGEKSKSNRKKLASEGFLKEYFQRGSVSRHSIRDLIDSMQLVGADEFKCSEWIEEPTLLVTRFEYANLFHTVTDWYNAYVSSRVTGLPIRPRLVFVDGHCLTPLEDAWRAMFSGLRYAKNFTGPVCFRQAILSPLGYESALSKGLTSNLDCHGASTQEVWQNPNYKNITARISEFGEMIKASFNLPLNKPNHTSNHHNILFVRREDYLAHPRHGGRVEPRLYNEKQVFDYLKKWASGHSKCKVNVIEGVMAHMPMKEQVRAIQEASVIVGAHGAGLTHIVSATNDAEIVEIIGNKFMRPHYVLISKWKGIKYHPMHIKGAYVIPSNVIYRVSRILKNLGC